MGILQVVCSACGRTSVSFETMSVCDEIKL